MTVPSKVSRSTPGIRRENVKVRLWCLITTKPVIMYPQPMLYAKGKFMHKKSMLFNKGKGSKEHCNNSKNSYDS